MTPQIDLQYEIKYFHDLLAAEEMKVAFDEVLEDSEVADEAIYNYEFCQNIGKTYACTGASKFVVLSYDWDWVLKIPFLGESINYCEIEKNIYEKAIEAGLEKFFTPMYYVGTFQTETSRVLPLYLSKKVETDIDYLDNVYSGLSDPHKSPKNISNEVLSYFPEGKVLAKLCEDYPENEVEKLCVFMEENYIGDMHAGNVGLTEDNKIIFLDYSGY